MYQRIEAGSAATIEGDEVSVFSVSAPDDPMMPVFIAGQEYPGLLDEMYLLEYILNREVREFIERTLADLQKAQTKIEEAIEAVDGISLWSEEILEQLIDAKGKIDGQCQVLDPTISPPHVYVAEASRMMRAARAATTEIDICRLRHSSI